MSLRDVGSFGQAGQVDKGSAHPQTDEEELGDELKVDEELSLVSAFFIHFKGDVFLSVTPVPTHTGLQAVFSGEVTQ